MVPPHQVVLPLRASSQATLFKLYADRLKSLGSGQCLQVFPVALPASSSGGALVSDEFGEDTFEFVEESSLTVFVARFLLMPLFARKAGTTTSRMVSSRG